MRRVSQAASAAILITGFIFFGGCHSIGQESPSEVVKAVYMAANEAKYSEAEKYISPEAIGAMKVGLGTLPGGMKGVWDEITRDGTIEKIEILDEEVRGDRAIIKIRIHFKDGETRDGDESLVREDGQWKITIG